MTQEYLLDAVIEDLERLFKGYKLRNSTGAELGIKICRQNLPVREGSDDAPEPEQPPEPYILVSLTGGEMLGNGAALTAEAVLLICVYDEAPDRQGYRDMLHIVNEIALHYGQRNIVGGKYEISYPVEWAAQQEDTHPYYFGGVRLNFELPAVYNETAEELC